MNDEFDHAASSPFGPTPLLDFRPDVDDRPRAPTPDRSGVSFEPDDHPDAIAPSPPQRPIFSAEAPGSPRPRATSVESTDGGPAEGPSRWMIATVALVGLLVAGFLGLSVFFNATEPSGGNVRVEVHGVTTIRDAPPTTR